MDTLSKLTLASQLPEYIRRVQKDIRSDSFVSVIMTDTHTNPDENVQMQNWYAFAEITKQIGPNFAANLGDIIQEPAVTVSPNPPTNAPWVDWMNKAMRTLEDIKSPVYLLHGNHDTNLIIENKRQRFVDPQLFTNITSRILEPNNKPVRNNKDRDTLHKPYYYQDFEEKKIRVIVLDSSDFPMTSNDPDSFGIRQYQYVGWQNEQLNWLAHTAFNMQGKDDWGVMILNHSHLDDSSGSGELYNGNLMIGLINAFIAGTSYNASSNGVNQAENWQAHIDVDFTDNPVPRFVSFLHGHAHYSAGISTRGSNFKAFNFNVGVNVTASNVYVATCVYHPETGKLNIFEFNNSANDRVYPLHPAPANKKYALKLSNARFATTFGKNMSPSEFKKILFKIKFDESATTPGTITSGTQYILQSFEAPSLKLGVVVTNGNKFCFVFGDSAFTVSNISAQPGVEYNVELDFSSGTSMKANINGQTIEISGSCSSFPANFGFGRNIGDKTQFFNGTLYDLKFVSANGSDYAAFDFYNGAGEVAKSSIAGRDLVLSGVYEWIEVPESA